MRYFILILVLVPIVLKAQKPFDKQAHRGGRGMMPENTIAAMKYALDLDNTLEMDLQYTKDKQVIVSHDNYMSSSFVLKPDGTPITKEEEKTLKVYNMIYDEVKKYDVGMKPHPQFPQQKKMKASISLLSEMIDSLEAYVNVNHLEPARYNIEAKVSFPVDQLDTTFRKEFIHAMMNIVLEKEIGKRVIIQCGDIGMLEILNRDFPKIKVSFLTAKGDLEANLKRISFKPDIFSPLYTLVTENMIDQCHKKGIKIIPWTVNTKKEIESLKNLGVDGIITDYPNLF